MKDTATKSATSQICKTLAVSVGQPRNKVQDNIKDIKENGKKH